MRASPCYAHLHVSSAQQDLRFSMLRTRAAMLTHVAPRAERSIQLAMFGCISDRGLFMYAL